MAVQPLCRIAGVLWEQSLRTQAPAGKCSSRWENVIEKQVFIHENTCHVELLPSCCWTPAGHVCHKVPVPQPCPLSQWYRSPVPSCTAALSPAVPQPCPWLCHSPVPCPGGATALSRAVLRLWWALRVTGLSPSGQVGGTVRGVCKTRCHTCDRRSCSLVWRWFWSHSFWSWFWVSVVCFGFLYPCSWGSALLFSLNTHWPVPFCRSVCSPPHRCAGGAPCPRTVSPLPCAARAAPCLNTAAL